MASTSVPGSAPQALRGISSMATRALLAELTAAHSARGGAAVQIESAGGVDAARRVAAGEAFDVVLLASDAIDKLIAAGHLQAPRVDWVRSPVAVAVRAGAARPDIGSEAAVRSAVLAARTLGYSTGPSGNFLVKLFERWGIGEQVAPKVVTPPPGVPVGSLLAKGEIELAFQQLSELKDLPGVDVIGLLPAEIACITTFSAAQPFGGSRTNEVQALLADLTGPQSAAIKRRHGMEHPHPSPLPHPEGASLALPRAGEGAKQEALRP